MFEFYRESEEVSIWISDMSIIAASEDYGQDLEHVEVHFVCLASHLCLLLCITVRCIVNHNMMQVCLWSVPLSSKNIFWRKKKVFQLLFFCWIVACLLFYSVFPVLFSAARRCTVGSSTVVGNKPCDLYSRYNFVSKYT